MLGEGRRGGTLEACLAKLLSSTGKENLYLCVSENNCFCSVNRVQIIAMSATLSNIDELARFLKADVYSSDFRPVLKFVMCGNHVVTIVFRLNSRSISS